MHSCTPACFTPLLPETLLPHRPRSLLPPCFCQMPGTPSPAPCHGHTQSPATWQLYCTTGCWVSMVCCVHQVVQLLHCTVPGVQCIAPWVHYLLHA